MGVGGCPAVVAQWQSTGYTSQVSWVRLHGDCQAFFPFRLSTSNLSLFQREARVLSIKAVKTTQHGFSPDGENFPVNPYDGTLSATETFSVLPVQYIYRIVRAGGCLVVIAQW